MLINRYTFKPLMKQITLNLSALLIALFVCLDLSNAHRVNLFAWVEGDTIFVESKFSGGKRVNAGKIIVTDPEGTELLTGTTNADGEFYFKIPQKTDLKIVLLAGPGHRAEWKIAASEIQMPASGKKPVPEKDNNFKGIIIGIGCIFGLTAVVAYIHRRKKIKLTP